MKKAKVWIAVLCALSLMLTGAAGALASEEETEDAAASLSYEFTGGDADQPGYAEGTVTLAAEDGAYKLYWSDDEAALDGYYEIAELEVAGGSAQYTFGYHVAIPADATKLIAAAGDEEYPAVADAAAVFDIPEEKLLGYTTDEELYAFNSFSDIHIDEEHIGQTPPYYWVYSEAHWADALEYAASMGVDFIVSSGDQVTNANLDTLDKEWQAYQYILAQSDYVNPIYESGGNHEVRQDGAVPQELQAFIAGSGLDSDLDTLAAAKPYYSVTEPSTGDLFIFMALEGGYRPAQYDEFTDEQLDWVEGLLDENYGQGKNIFIVQHALISGYGPGDDTETPYYGGSLNQDLPSVQRFISILEAHPDVIWISGHSHEDLTLDYNFTNNDGASCYMIHNPSVGNPTHVTDGAIDYTFYEDNSQGYYVQVFEDAILFNGANLVYGKILPAYCYIIPGGTSALEVEEEPGFIFTDVTVDGPAFRSLLANARTLLGIYYEYSSYDQYQALKSCYYQYEGDEAEADDMDPEELASAYSSLRLAIGYLHQVVEAANGREFEVVLQEPEPEATPEPTLRDSELTVRIHYHREDGDYEPWSVWLWSTGDGTDNPFTGTDDFGVYLEYTVAPEITSLGFIVRTQSWDKDIDADQFINVDGTVTGETLDVYIESGVEGYEVR